MRDVVGIGTILRICLSVVAIAAGLALIPAAASAAPAPVRYADTGARLSVAYGPACAGNVHASAVSADELYIEPGTTGVSAGTRDNRGVLYLSGGGEFFGISGTGLPCEVTLTIHWRNMVTGAAGSVGGVVSGLLLPVAPYETISENVRTGSGRVEFWVSTDRPHIAQPAAVINVY